MDNERLIPRGFWIFLWTVMLGFAFISFLVTDKLVDQIEYGFFVVLSVFMAHGEIINK